MRVAINELFNSNVTTYVHTYVQFSPPYCIAISLVYMWQSQVENEHYSTVSGLIRLVISLECFIEITPDFLCPFMND